MIKVTTTLIKPVIYINLAKFYFANRIECTTFCNLLPSIYVHLNEKLDASFLLSKLQVSRDSLRIMLIILPLKM